MRLPDDGDMAYGVSLDLLNQLLWVAWQTGDFDDPDLAGLLGREIPGLDEIEALLPPVVRPGIGGATLGVDWDVVVGSDAPIDEAAFRAAIEAAMSEFVELYVEDLADAIPTTGEIDFSDLPGLPAGLTLGLQDAIVGGQDGYVTLSGTIR